VVSLLDLIIRCVWHPANCFLFFVKQISYTHKLLICQKVCLIYLVIELIQRFNGIFLVIIIDWLTAFISNWLSFLLGKNFTTIQSYKWQIIFTNMIQKKLSLWSNMIKFSNRRKIISSLQISNFILPLNTQT